MLARLAPVAMLMTFIASFATSAPAQTARKTLLLDGTWQIAEGSMDQMPKSFDHQAPVPGLADMAQPAFEGVGPKDKDPRREAFWYRRAFPIEGPVPPVAMLKIHKARYGTRVYLNGQLLGDHVPCFTPGYFDLRKHLKGNGEANELTIRVGASHTALSDDVPWGHDFEKIRYIPGIYDSVEVILSGTPHIVRAQVVPDVPGKAVRVVALVKNKREMVEDVVVRCVVREAANGKIVATTEGKSAWKAGEEQSVDLSTAIENCRLWSPEDPFLYTLELTVRTLSVSLGSGPMMRNPSGQVTDTYTTRFGMRSFSFDPKTKLPMLNGEPYYLRGTNICIYRFFEDPLCGDKPWREEWVRKVIRSFRSMHWNSARYCIGFPPEMWYRIADEEGLLIQDEFPVWGKTGSLENLTAQYTEWMQERWNHPSVVIWDAQNETPKQNITGKALTAVRHLDLSNRPWDNGWDAPQIPTDVYESHPYRHIKKGFRMSEFATMSPRPGDPGSDANNDVPNTGNNPIIINEYGWLWLNRDGSPCTIPVHSKSYQYLVPPDATADQYREAYARTVAAKTEFWRCGRKVAGVMHFCGLGYSRSGGQTSDNYIDIEKPAFEPHFYRYVRDAFAPVGLMVDFWAEQLPAGTTQKVSVVAISDLPRGVVPFQGPITLRLLRDGKTISEQSQQAKLPPASRAVFAFSVDIPAEPGKYQFVAELEGLDHKPVQSLRDFKVGKE